MKTCLWILSLLVCAFTYAQPEVSNTVISSASQSKTIYGISISSTIGEAIIFDGKSPAIKGNQGFQTGSADISTAVVSLGGRTSEVKYFPNPTKDNVTIVWKDLQIESIELRNVLGIKIISQKNLTKSNQIKLDLNGNGAGMYSIIISDLHHRAAPIGWFYYSE